MYNFNESGSEENDFFAKIGAAKKNDDDNPKKEALLAKTIQ